MKNKKSVDVPAVEARNEMNDRMRYMTAEQIQAVNELVRALGSQPGKGALMKLAFDGDATGVDSALPHDWVVKVQEILPTFDVYSHAMSYKEPTTHGSVVNVKEMIIDNLIKTLNK